MSLRMSTSVMPLLWTRRMWTEYVVRRMRRVPIMVRRRVMRGLASTTYIDEDIFNCI